MPQSSLFWDTHSNSFPVASDERPLTEAALRCFMEPSPENLSALQTMLEHFQNENALVTRKRQPPQCGVDSAENHAFRQNDALKYGVFQKQNTLDPQAEQSPPATVMRHCVLVLQTANAVLEEEAKAVTELFAREGNPLVCAPGCAGCCHQMVLCHPFEAEAIAAFLRANPPALEAFLVAYAAWDARTHGLRQSYLAWAEKLYCHGQDDNSHTREDYHSPCPFLDPANRCTIYPVRPYGCRTSVAVDPACSSPETGLPGSRNIHLSHLTGHHAAREPLMALLLERLPTSPRLPMPERVRQFFA